MQAWGERRRKRRVSGWATTWAVWQSAQAGTSRLSADKAAPFVGVEAEDPVAAGDLESGVARGGEVVVPASRGHAGPGGRQQVRRGVDRAGVHDAQLVPDARRGLQEAGQHGGLVAHDDGIEPDAKHRFQGDAAGLRGLHVLGQGGRGAYS